MQVKRGAAGVSATVVACSAPWVPAGGALWPVCCAEGCGCQQPHAGAKLLQWGGRGPNTYRAHHHSASVADVQTIQESNKK